MVRSVTQLSLRLYDFKLYEHLLTVARRERRTRSAPRGSVTTFLRVGTKCSA